MTQTGSNTPKSETSIQSRTALNAREMEDLVTDQLEAAQQREHRDTRDFVDTRTSSRRRCQYQEGKEVQEMLQQCAKESRFVASVQQHCSNRKIGILLTMDPTLHC